MTYTEIKARARKYGITKLEHANLEAYEPMSDGCSGGLSWLYALGGTKISCHRACVAHDYLYDQGGTARDRKKADKLLRWCAAVPPSLPRLTDTPGTWWGAMKSAARHLADCLWWPMRRAWRQFRAWVMYAGVRLVGWHENHWAGSPQTAGGVSGERKI